MASDRADSTRVSSEVLHYGLASMMLGALFVLMAPTALLLAFWLQISDYKGFSAEDTRLAARGGYASVAAIMLLSVVGIGIGMRGLLAAIKSGHTGVLSLCGMLVNLLSLAIWLGVGVAWHSQALRFLR